MIERFKRTKWSVPQFICFLNKTSLPICDIATGLCSNFVAATALGELYILDKLKDSNPRIYFCVRRSCQRKTPRLNGLAFDSPFHRVKLC